MRKLIFLKNSRYLIYLLLLSLVIGFGAITCSTKKLDNTDPSKLLSSSKDITAFTFEAAKNAAFSTNATGIITGANIAVTVPFGASVLALVPTIEITGASVNPPSDTAQDFSSPVNHTVTAEDGSTKVYTVTVTIATSSAKDITAFQFNAAENTVLSADATGAITDTNIAVTVPFGTTVMGLVPAISITGASVSPSSGTAQDFSSPVNYTVTAADSTTKTYTVTVTKEAATKDITAFRFNAADNGLALSADATGTITGTEIAVTVPEGTTVTALAPTITHDGASISPASGTAQDFSSSVTYTVTAEDSTTQTYTVAVTIAAAAATTKDITVFNFNATDNVVALSFDVAGTITGAEIAVTVPDGTTVTALAPAITHDGASISPANGAAQDFSSPVTYTVTAEDLTTQTYTVTVTIAAPKTTKDIAGFIFNEADNGALSLDTAGTITGADIAITVPYGTTITALVPTVSITGASVSPTSGAAQDFSSSVDYTVTAEDSTTQIYTVTVTIASQTLGGAVIGLESGETLTLQNNATDDLIISRNEPFTLVPIANGDGYDVTVLTQPVSQTCLVTNGNGTASTASITNVLVTCSAGTTGVDYIISNVAYPGSLIVHADQSPSGTIDIEVLNQGTAAGTGGYFWTTVYLSSDQTLDWGDSSLNGPYFTGDIAAGATESQLGINLYASAYNNASGVYYLIIVADYYNDETEVSGFTGIGTEGNNVFVTGPVIVTNQGADLEITAISNPPTAMNTHEGATVNFTLTNSSVFAAPNDVVVAAFLSTSDTWNDWTVNLGRTTVTGGVPGSGNVNSSINISIPDTLASGTYYVWLYADYWWQNNEIDRTNNEKGNTSGITVTQLTTTPYFIGTYGNAATCATNTDTILDLYDSTGNFSITSNDDGSSAGMGYSLINIGLLSGNTYKVRVTGYWTSSFRYSLKWDTTDPTAGGDSTGVPACPDSNESNDTAATATLLPFNTVSDNTVNPDGEEDWFTIIVP